MTTTRNIIPISDIKIEKQLSKNNSNTIFLASWKNRPVVIKALALLGNETHTQYANRCLTEIKMTNHARCDYSINLHGYVIAEHPNHVQFGIVLDYAAQGSLVDYCNAYPFIPPHLSYHFFKQIVKGMYHLKEATIIHGDIKLANILVANDNCVKIADYGLSQFQHDPNKRYSGTPSYMAPEVVNKISKISFESDVFSLSCLLYSLMQGTENALDFGNVSDKTSPFEIVSDHYSKNLRHPINTHWPSKISRLITWGWATKPEERVTIEQLNDEVELDEHTQSESLQQKELDFYGYSSSANVLKLVKNPEQLHADRLTKNKLILPLDHNQIQIFNAYLDQKQVSLKAYHQTHPLQFRHECQMASLLQERDAPCSDIIGYMVDTTVSPTRYTIVSTFFSNIPVDMYIERVSHTLDERFQFSYRAVKAVAYVHSKGVIHGNIKPERFLIDPTSKQIIITGYSHSAIDPIHPIALGSPMYMAPEVIAEERPISFASDIFSLARLLYYFARATELTLEDFSCQGNKEVKPKKLVKEHYAKEFRYKLDPVWPPKIAKLITWGWQTKPENRITIAQLEKEMELGLQEESMALQNKKLTFYPSV